MHWSLKFIRHSGLFICVHEYVTSDKSVCVFVTSKEKILIILNICALFCEV